MLVLHMENVYVIEPRLSGEKVGAGPFQSLRSAPPWGDFFCYMLDDRIGAMWVELKRCYDKQALINVNDSHLVFTAPSV